jgi:hypothetical protein
MGKYGLALDSSLKDNKAVWKTKHIIIQNLQKKMKILKICHIIKKMKVGEIIITIIK